MKRTSLITFKYSILIIVICWNFNLTNHFNLLFYSSILQALSDEANELLPIFNKTSSKFYRATVPTGDWSNQVKHPKKKTKELDALAA